MKILVIEAGVTHVKLLATGHQRRIEGFSGPKMAPAKMVAALRCWTTTGNAPLFEPPRLPAEASDNRI